MSDGVCSAGWVMVCATGSSLDTIDHAVNEVHSVEWHMINSTTH